MPRDRATGAQMITFELRPFVTEQWVDAHPGPGRDTVAKITHSYGIRDRAREVAERNEIHSVYSKLKRKTIKVPRPRPYGRSGKLDVIAGDGQPRITSGYAKYSVTDRPARTGLLVFQGYDPIVMEVPIRFDAYMKGSRRGEDIEDDIAMLERMAGRGIGSVSGTGAPGAVTVSTTDNSGDVVPLISHSYQPSPRNPNPPLWVISDIQWDDDGLSNKEGNTVRQTAVVELTQFVREGGVRLADATHSGASRRPIFFRPSWYRG